MDTITLYYTCSKCGRENSQLACPPSIGPYYDCPYCGGPLIFQPNCWTCAEFVDMISCDVVDCIGFKAYHQREVQ